MDEPAKPATDASAQAMRAEIERLNKVVQALMNRAERNAGIQGSDFNLFQTAITLEDQVRRRTAELEAALLENQKITRALHESEDHYRAFFLGSSVPMLLIDPADGRIVDANAASEKYYGYTLSQLRAMNIAQINTLSREEVAQEMAAAAQAKKNYFNFRHRLANGEVRDVEVHSGAVNLKDHRLLYSIVHDVTERKLIETALHDMNRDFVAFLDNTTDFIYFKDADSRFRFCSQTMADVTGHANWRDMTGKHDLEVFPADTARIYHEEELPIFRDGQPLLNKIDPYYDAQGRQGWVSTNKWPVFDKEGKQVVGLFGISRDITERKQMEQQLQEREALFHAIFDQADSGIELIDPDSLRFVEVNPATCRMLGYTREEMLQMRLEDTQVDMDHAALMDSVQRTEAAGGSIFENRHRCKNGDILNVEINAHILHISGKRLIIALWRDVTESKRAEENLLAREREFRTLAENLPDNIARYDCAGRVLYANHALELTLGAKTAQFLGKTPLEFLPGELFDTYQKTLFEVAATGERASFEQIVPVSEGRPHVHSIQMVPELGQDGAPVGVLAVGHDISESKWAEENLRIIASVFENSQEGIVITDADNRFLDVNPAFSRITGYSHDEAIGKGPEILNSGRQNKAFYERMWQSLQEKRAWRGEIMNRRKSGEIFSELLSIAAICDDKGKLQRYVGVFSDISYIKAHETELSRIAHYDALTGVPNRVLMVDRLDQIMAASKRSGKYGAAMFLDLDNFKPLNDTHGHEMGDLLLREVARRISSCVREMDTVARYGGDEFVVVLSEMDADRGLSTEQAAMVAEKIRNSLAEPYVLARKPAEGEETRVEHHCTASIGVVLFLGHENSREDILKRADMAMYQAKEAGRNRVSFYDGAS